MDYQMQGEALSDIGAILTQETPKRQRLVGRP